MADNLVPVLLNVRKAYRLLNAYHQRILSTIQQIGKVFPDREFEAWQPDMQYRRQKWSRDVLENASENAFGLNPLQSAHFLFRPANKKPIPWEWLLDVTHTGDTAYWSDDYDTASLAPAEGAETQFGIYAFLVLDGSSDSWYDLWSNSFYPGDDLRSDIKLDGEAIWQGTPTGCKVWAFGRDWSVADFANERLLNTRYTDFQRLVDRMMTAAHAT